MNVVGEKKHLSSDDEIIINKQVKADLINHLYEGCLPGTVSGIVAAIALFFDFYHYTSFYLLIAWVIIFNVMMIAFSGLYVCYKKFKNKLLLITWEKLYSIMMCNCAVLWIPVIFLMPDDLTRQYLALIVIFLALAGYATGTIGQFRLCVTTLAIILTPLIAWALFKGGIFYNILVVYSLTYMIFLCGANLRSTTWFKESLKLKLENTLVSYQANHDLLTDLPNQRLLQQYIDSAIEAVHQTENTFCLVCFSLNRMEMIDDSLGHKASDAIIQAVANRFRTLADFSGRDGITCIITISRKDIFNILLLPIKEKEVENKVQTLFSVIDEPFYLEDREVRMTASIGVSIFGKDGQNMQSLLMSADSAMLQAKQFGGNCFKLYRAELNAQLPRKLELETDLHHALKQNQLQVYYQPIVDLKTGKISGMEALLRWLHPVHGFISPAHFIPIAEESGLIIPIGEWVLKQACKQTRIWHRMGFSDLKIAVNLAGKQLHDANILKVVERILEETQFDHRYLEIEITETAILEGSVIPILQQFKKLGVSLSVDDFGTGYSGLSYLKRFSIDKLKIDQSFIKDIPQNNGSITIVSAILAMGRELGVNTLAEGVETEAQLEFLKTKGCNFIQGYYFSKPLETSHFTQLLLNDVSLIAQRATEI